MTSGQKLILVQFIPKIQKKIPKPLRTIKLYGSLEDVVYYFGEGKDWSTNSQVQKNHFALAFNTYSWGFLRFYQIDKYPKAMYGDSLTLVYDAYSILKTGRDQKGEFLPLVFSLGGNRPAGYVYATIPFVALFGPTPLTARMVSVLSGIGILILSYLLGKAFISEGAGVAISAIAALNPWALSLSRGPFESHFALFLALLGFYSFARGLKNHWWLIIFGLSFALSEQTYSTYKLTIPLFTLLLLIWSRHYKLISNQKKSFFHLKIFSLGGMLALTAILASTFLAIYLTISRGGRDRFVNINIFNSEKLKYDLSVSVRNDRDLESLNPFLSSILHRTQIELVAVLGENYFGNFSPSFLFMHGDGEPRHNPAEMGEFFWIDAFLLILGITYLCKLNRKLLLFLFGWILIAPIPTSLVGPPHALRDSFLLPPLIFLIGNGLWQLVGVRLKTSNRLPKVTLTFLAIIFLIQFIFFIDRFYFVAPQKSARNWSYPAKRASLLALLNRQDFKFVILSNDIDNMEFAYPVYANLDPRLVIGQNANPSKIGEYSFFQYNNVYIGSLPHSRIKEFIKSLPGSVLYIGSDKEQSSMENYIVLRGFDAYPDLIISAKGVVPEIDLPK